MQRTYILKSLIFAEFQKTNMRWLSSHFISTHLHLATVGDEICALYLWRGNVELVFSRSFDFLHSVLLYEYLLLRCIYLFIYIQSKLSCI